MRSNFFLHLNNLIIGLLFFLNISTNAFATNTTKDEQEIRYNSFSRKFLVSNPKVLNLTLAPLLLKECLKLNLDDCKNATGKFLRNLKLEAIDVEIDNKKIQYTIGLTKELNELSQDPKVHYFIKHLLSKTENLKTIIINGEYQNSDNIDLLKEAFIYFNDYQFSLKVLSALFQDVGPTYTQIYYLESINTPAPLLRGLKGVLDNLQEIEKQSIKYANIYGETISPIRFNQTALPNSKIYHLTMPLYLSEKLLKSNINKMTSAFMPFLLNYIYQVSKIKSGIIPSAIMTPKTIDFEIISEDIYQSEIALITFMNTEDYNLSLKKTKYLLKSDTDLYLKYLKNKITK